MKRLSQEFGGGRPDDQIVRLSSNKAHQGGSKRRQERRIQPLQWAWRDSDVELDSTVARWQERLRGFETPS